MSSLHAVRNTASALCAAALHEVLPGAELLGGQETETGFFYHFSTPSPFTAALIPLLEEKMRQMIREDRPIRALEMVAVSAQELFYKLGHAVAVDALAECAPKELVSVVQIGSFYELAEGPFVPALRSSLAVQIISIEPQGEGEFRIEGCAAPTKEALKIFLRQLHKYGEENHFSLGEDLALWEACEGQLVWRPRGLRGIRLLTNFLVQKIIDPDAEEVRAVSPGWEKYLKKNHDTSVWRLHPSLQGELSARRLFEEDLQTELTWVCPDSDLSCISLLQKVHKTLIILGFHPEVCLRGRKTGGKSLKLLEQRFLELGVPVRFEKDEYSAVRAQWLEKDGLGLLRPTAELKVDGSLSLKLGVERIFALLLEKTVGDLPFWLIPEHVRVLALEERNREYAHLLKAELESRGFRSAVDARPKPLKQRISDAMSERVPCVAVVGDRERETNTASLKAARFGEEARVSWGEMIERLNRTFKLEN